MPKGQDHLASAAGTGTGEATTAEAAKRVVRIVTNATFILSWLEVFGGVSENERIGVVLCVSIKNEWMDE